MSDIGSAVLSFEELFAHREELRRKPVVLEEDGEIYHCVVRSIAKRRYPGRFTVSLRTFDRRPSGRGLRSVFWFRDTECSITRDAGVYTIQSDRYTITIQYGL